MARSSGETNKLRIRRIIGQARAVERLMNENADCDIILQEIMAARNALGSLGAEVVSQECGVGFSAKRSKKLDRLLQKFLKFK